MIWCRPWQFCTHPSLRLNAYPMKNDGGETAHIGWDFFPKRKCRNCWAIMQNKGFRWGEIYLLQMKCIIFLIPPPDPCDIHKNWKCKYAFKNYRGTQSTDNIKHVSNKFIRRRKWMSNWIYVNVYTEFNRNIDRAPVSPRHGTWNL